jgi:CRISP-associated protein Cas1
MSYPLLHKHKQIFTIIARPEQQDQLKLTNTNLAFYCDGNIVSKIPIYKIQFVLLMGEMTITTPLIARLSQNQVSIIFVKHNFESYFYTSDQPTFGDKDLKLAQYKTVCNQKVKLQIATKIVQNKINNQIQLVQKKNSVNLTTPKIEAKSIEQLMGIEGSVSAKYFSLLFQKLQWQSRIPRAKHDIPNFLLDIGYTYLFNFVSTLCTQLGYENTFGFLHADYYQRQSLVCDLMEPIRPIIDNALVNAYSRKQIKPEHFEIKDDKIQLIDYRNIGLYTDIFGKVIIQYQDQIYTYLKGFGEDLKNYSEIKSGKPFTTFDL